MSDTIRLSKRITELYQCSRREAELLGRRIDASMAGDGKGIAAVAAAGEGDRRGVERVPARGALTKSRAAARDRV